MKTAQEIIDEIENEPQIEGHNDGGLFVESQAKLEEISWKILNNKGGLKS